MMEERTVMHLLRAVHEEDVAAAPRRHPLQTEQCPSLPRFWEVLIDPRRWTPEEQAHVRDCPYCQRFLPRFQEELWHPSLKNLLLWRVGQLTGEEAPYVRVHLEEDTCLRCTTLVRALQIVPSLKRLVEQVQRGAVGALEQVEGKLRRLVFSSGPQPDPLPRPARAYASRFQGLPSPTSGLIPLPALAACFASEEQPEVFVQYQSEDGSLLGTLRETGEGDLMLVVETRDPSLRGGVVRAALTDGEGQEVVGAFLALRPDFEEWASGRVRLGTLGDLSTRLNGACHFFALPVEPDEVTPEEVETLRWSLERAKVDDPEASETWRQWLGSLPADVRAALGEVSG